MNSDDENKVNLRETLISIGRESVILDNANSKIAANGQKSHGFHLVRSKWDPYPWIESVDNDSSAEMSGLRSGDCLLEIDGQDVLGLEMKAIGRLIGHNDRVSLGVWRRPPKSQRHNTTDLASLEDKEPTDPRADHTGTLLEGPLPEVAQKLVQAVSGVVRALECPVCLESAAPPVSQCVHGHLLCCSCRPKNARCPVCRVRLGQGRCLLADISHRALTDALLGPPTTSTDHQTRLPARSLRHSIFGTRRRESGLESEPRLERPTRRLLSRLLGGPGSRNASTESLPAAGCESRPWLLRLHDRRKSASTGELSRPRRDEDEETSRSGSLLSVPQTPLWGGSTESVVGHETRLCCPLRQRDRCHEPLTPSALLRHLGSSRHDGPMIHYYRDSISLPLPFPFHAQALYVLQPNDEGVFFMQNDDNGIWMSNTHTNSDVTWQWTLRGEAENGTEICIKKDVVSLQEPFELLPRHVLTLPDNFKAVTVTVSLVKQNVEEGCIKV